MIPTDSTTAGLRSLAFIRLWTGSTASSLATWGFPFVLGLAMLDGMLSPTLLGSALAMRTLAFLVALPISGVMADRSGARRVIVAASALATVGVALVVVGLFAPQAGEGASALTAAVTIGALLAGAGQGACRPAYQAMVPAIVAPDDLQGANAAMSISVRVTGVLGPTLATGITLTWSATAALVAIAGLWIISTAAPPRIASAVAMRATSSLSLARFGTQWLEGMTEARQHRWFLAGLGALSAVIAGLLRHSRAAAPDQCQIFPWSRASGLVHDRLCRRRPARGRRDQPLAPAKPGLDGLGGAGPVWAGALQPGDTVVAACSRQRLLPGRNRHRDLQRVVVFGHPT